MYIASGKGNVWRESLRDRVLLFINNFTHSGCYLV